MAKWKQKKTVKVRKDPKKVRCSQHNGIGPGPRRIWNGRVVCFNCYKTLTKYRLVRDPQQRSQSQSRPAKGFFTWLFGG